MGTLKKKDLITLYNSIYAIKNQKGKEAKAKFKYTLNKALSLMDADMKVLKDIDESNGEIIKNFREERYEIFKKYGTATEDGGYSIPFNDVEKRLEAAKELKAIEEKYAKERLEYDAKQLEFDARCEEEVHLDFEKFSSIEDIPDWVDMETIDTFEKAGLIPEGK